MMMMMMMIVTLVFVSEKEGMKWTVSGVIEASSHRVWFCVFGKFLAGYTPSLILAWPREEY